MDRLNQFVPGKQVVQTRKPNRAAALVLFTALLAGVILIKAFHDGWFEPRTALNLNGKPALVFFSLRRGCECQMNVVEAAQAQISGWSIPGETGIQLLKVDFSRRPDLADQYHVIRAPALVLLDGYGQLIWKQDVGLSDEAPLDLDALEAEIRQLRVHSP